MFHLRPEVDLALPNPCSARSALVVDSYGSIPVESVILATGSQSVSYQWFGRTESVPGTFSGSGRDSSSDPNERRNSRRDVVAAPGSRRIVILRFFVGGVLVSTPETLLWTRFSTTRRVARKV